MTRNISPERWQRISALFDEVLDLPPDERASFLERVCGGDEDLRRQVEQLVGAAERESGFLDQPALLHAGSLLRKAADDEEPDAVPTATLAPAGDATAVIDSYRLLQKLGEGGMGEVWLAEQTQPVRRTVALKLIKSGMDTKQVIARFEAERQALALMDHPAIARVFDAGQTDRGLPYFAMEYVKGEAITTYCDRHCLVTRERLALFTQVCDGVQHAHQKGIIHRDLKPSNVLVAIQDDTPVPKIIDFGVAKATAQRLTEKTMFTELGALVGTPEYMSPEQAEMTGLDVDTRTDVYALGVVLYQLLTGALPFDSKDLREAGYDEIRRRIREVDPPRPSSRISTLKDKATDAAHKRRMEPRQLARGLRGDLDWIVMKALEKDRTRRYGSPSELAADIGRHLHHEPVLAGPPSALYRTGKFVRRHRFGVAAAALGVVALAAFGIAMAFQVKTTARERERAERVSDFLVGLFSVADPGQARGNSITAREVLDRGAKQLQTELKNDPITQARLLETMASAYMGLGLYAKAEELYGRAAELRRTALGKEHPLTLQSRLAQAYALLRLSRIDEAQKRLTDLIPVLRRVLGEEDPHTLQSLDNYATTLEEQGRHAESGPIYRRVLEARLRVLGKDDRLTIWSEQNVGFNLLARGLAAKSAEQKALYAESEKMLRDAVADFERVLGPDHPDTLWARRSLVQNLEAQNRLSEAEAMQRVILETTRRVVGPDHVNTYAGEHILARILAQEKRYEESETLFRHSLEGYRRLLGQDHSRTRRTMIDWATVLYIPRGDFAKGEPLLRESYEGATMTHDDAERVEAAYNLGCFNAQRGDRQVALDWLRKSVEAGYSDAAGMSTDPDLASLRGDPEFEKLLAALRSKAPPTGNQP